MYGIDLNSRTVQTHAPLLQHRNEWLSSELISEYYWTDFEKVLPDILSNFTHFYISSDRPRLTTIFMIMCSSDYFDENSHNLLSSVRKDVSLVFFTEFHVLLILRTQTNLIPLQLYLSPNCLLHKFKDSQTWLESLFPEFLKSRCLSSLRSTWSWKGQITAKTVSHFNYHILFTVIMQKY